MGIGCLCLFSRNNFADRSGDAEVHDGGQSVNDDIRTRSIDICSIFFNRNTVCLYSVSNVIGMDYVQRLFIYIKCSNQ